MLVNNGNNLNIISYPPNKLNHRIVDLKTSFTEKLLIENDPAPCAMRLLFSSTIDPLTTIFDFVLDTIDADAVNSPWLTGRKKYVVNDTVTTMKSISTD